MEKIDSTPLLSVIVPVYNVEQYLEQCVSSILNQDYYNIEVILVNDGSKDKSGAICDELAKRDKRIVVIHKPNGGQGSARNRALDIARGNYITFVDSDDEITKDTYQINIQILEANRDIDILQYPVIEHYGTLCPNIRIIDKPQKVCGKNNIFFSWLSPSDKRVTGYVCNKIYRRHIFDTLRFREDIVWEDRYIECDFFGLCNGIYISDVGKYLYYDREGSTVRRKRDEYYYKSVCIADSKLINSIEGISVLNEIKQSRSILLYYYCVELAKRGALNKHMWAKDKKQIIVPIVSFTDIVKSNLSLRQKITCLQGTIFGLNFIERRYAK